MKKSLLAWGAVLALATALFVLFSLSAPESVAAQSGPDGEAIYEANCAGCHGDDGTGVAGRGRPLTGIADQGTVAGHVKSVTDGKGNMPAFEDKLEADEIEAAVTYAHLAFMPEADDAAKSDAADSSGSSASGGELARTGVDTEGLALLGTSMIAAGFGLTLAGKRARRRRR